MFFWTHNYFAIPNRIPELLALPQLHTQHWDQGSSFFLTQHQNVQKPECLRSAKLQEAEDTCKTKTKLRTGGFQRKKMKCSQNRESENLCEEMKFKRGVDCKK